ncbi:MAG TPA: PIG-L deacetylase family protein [Thermoanaerobaculia bacterium]|nr:PIG-L deacetylase family protein [Thermoanaerobaculia bacterium]
MTILLSFAHPDDESFFTAGISRQHAEAGRSVVLCCATRGERGSAGNPPLTSIEELPATRERELRAAAEIMGIGRIEMLPYRDRELADAPPDEIRASLVSLIRRHRPEVVITFDPQGGNLHPDHIAISRFTTDAVTAAADARFHPESGPPHRVPRLLWVGTVLPWEETDPARLAERPGVDFLIDIRPWRDIKARALAAHRTQHQSIGRYFLERPDRDAILSFETFRLAAGEPVEAPPLDDLFTGLTAESA